MLTDRVVFGLTRATPGIICEFLRLCQYRTFSWYLVNYPNKLMILTKHSRKYNL